MRLRVILLALVGAGVGLAAAAGTPPGGDAVRGQDLYERRCTGCHSLDSNRVGPKHRGVFGRPVGGADDYSYSGALAGSTLIWTEATLDRWLADPQAFLPGQRMNIRVRDARDRADLIAFLKRESVPKPGSGGGTP